MAVYRTTFSEFEKNYCPKNGQIGDEIVLGKPSLQLKREQDDTYEFVNVLKDYLETITGPIGDEQLDFIPNKSYNKGDVVIKDGKMYESLVDDNIVFPPDPATWKEIIPITERMEWTIRLLEIMSEVGNMGTPYIPPVLFDEYDIPEEGYGRGDFVTFDGLVWVSLSNENKTTPSATNTLWHHIQVPKNAGLNGKYKYGQTSIIDFTFRITDSNYNATTNIIDLNTIMQKYNELEVFSVVINGQTLDDYEFNLANKTLTIPKIYQCVNGDEVIIFATIIVTKLLEFDEGGTEVYEFDYVTLNRAATITNNQSYSYLSFKDLTTFRKISDVKACFINGILLNNKDWEFNIKTNVLVLKNGLVVEVTDEVSISGMMTKVDLDKPIWNSAKIPGIRWGEINPNDPGA